MKSVFFSGWGVPVAFITENDVSLNGDFVYADVLGVNKAVTFFVEQHSDEIDNETIEWDEKKGDLFKVWFRKGSLTFAQMTKIRGTPDYLTEEAKELIIKQAMVQNGEDGDEDDETNKKPAAV